MKMPPLIETKGRAEMHLWEAVVHGLIWAALWSALVVILLLKFPASMLGDYPKEMQAIARVPELNRKRYTPVAAFAWVIIFAYYAFAALWVFRLEEASYFSVALFSFIVFMMWSIVDLLILDWFLFCTLQPKFMVLPGTEGHPQYKNYFFHFVAFCKGTLYAVAFSAVGGGVMYAVLRFAVWR